MGAGKQGGDCVCALLMACCASRETQGLLGGRWGGYGEGGTLGGEGLLFWTHQALNIYIKEGALATTSTPSQVLHYALERTGARIPEAKEKLEKVRGAAALAAHEALLLDAMACSLWMAVGGAGGWQAVV